MAMRASSPPESLGAAERLQWIRLDVAARMDQRSLIAQADRVVLSDGVQNVVAVRARRHWTPPTRLTASAGSGATATRSRSRPTAASSAGPA